MSEAHVAYFLESHFQTGEEPGNFPLLVRNLAWLGMQLKYADTRSYPHEDIVAPAARAAAVHWTEQCLPRFSPLQLDSGRLRIRQTYIRPLVQQVEHKAPMDADDEDDGEPVYNSYDISLILSAATGNVQGAFEEEPSADDARSHSSGVDESKEDNRSRSESVGPLSEHKEASRPRSKSADPVALANPVDDDGASPFEDAPLTNPVDCEPEQAQVDLDPEDEPSNSGTDSAGPVSIDHGDGESPVDDDDDDCDGSRADSVSARRLARGASDNSATSETTLPLGAARRRPREDGFHSEDYPFPAKHQRQHVRPRRILPALHTVAEPNRGVPHDA
jgi:hypothetical protein